MKSKMENLTHSVRETNLVLQPIKKSQINSKTVMNLSPQKKKMAVFVSFILFEENVFNIYLMYSVLNTISEYTYFNILHTLFYLFLKSSKAFRSLRWLGPNSEHFWNEGIMTIVIWFDCMLTNCIYRISKI